MPSSPILYSFRRCPYAMRARMALIYSGIQVELREVVLKDKPAELLALSPKGTVPVLLCDNGTLLEESLDIMFWAVGQHDPDTWLSQQQPQLDLIQKNDDEFKPWLDRYKYADRFPEHSEQHYREQCEVFLNTLEDRLQHHSYLFGEQVRLADIAIFPFIRQFAHVDLNWFEASEWSALKRWLSGFKESVLFTRAMTKFAPWHAGDAALLFPPADHDVR